MATLPPRSFQVESIEAKSDIPLYLRTSDPTTGAPGTFKIITAVDWNTLWAPGDGHDQPVLAAFDVSAGVSLTGKLRVRCTFSGDLVGRTLDFEGLLSGVPAISSKVSISGTDAIEISDFVFPHQFEGPVKYCDGFTWRLMDGGTLVTASGTQTSLEFYSVLSRPSAIWMAWGFSGNLLRTYATPFSPSILTWDRAAFYRGTVQTVFDSPFRYHNTVGRSTYFKLAPDPREGSFRLNQYFKDLEARRQAWVNCYDMAGILQTILTTYRTPGRWFFMQPFGYIKKTNLKGWGDCNNPFFGLHIFNSDKVAPVNKPDNPSNRLRSGFFNHAFIAAPSSPGQEVILDATSGPHTGTEDLNTYIANSIENRTETDYYDRGGLPLGTAANATSHRGVIQIHSLPNSSPSFRTLVEGVKPAPPSDAVDEAMKLAKVEGADPALFPQINPTELKSLVGKTSGSKFTSEEVNAGEKGSEAVWLFGDRPEGVEVTLFAADSHDTALQCMKDALTAISAPLKELFESTLHLGQYTLNTVTEAGLGLILFVRGNVFIELVGMASSKELGKVAVAVDGFLKKSEGKSKTVPIITKPNSPARQLKLGEKITVTIDVKEAGWMSVYSDSMVLQLTKVEEKKATFEFCAGGKGKTEVKFVFAHEKSLQTATATMNVEVKDVNGKQYPEALAAIEELPQASPSPAAEPTYLARELTELSAKQLSYGQLHGALESSKGAVEMCRNLPYSQNTTSALAYALYGLSNCLTEAGRKGDALAAAVEAVTLYRKITPNLTPLNGCYDYNVADALYTFAACLEESGRSDDALTNTLGAADIYRTVVATRTEYYPKFAQVLHSLSIRLWEAGRYIEAASACEEEVTVRRRLASGNQDLPMLHRALCDLSIRRSQVGQLSDAASASWEAENIRNEHLTAFKHISSPADGCGEAIGLKELESAYTTPSRAFNRLRIVKAIIFITLYFASTFIWAFFSRS